MSTIWKELIPSGLLDERIKVLARGVQSYIDDSRTPVVLAIVTQGGTRIGMELVKLLKPETYHWGLIGTGSYGSHETGGSVNLQFNRLGPIAGKRVVIVDDIGDRRATLKYLQDYFLGPEKAVEVRNCVLLNKPSRQECNVPLHWVGFNIPNTFVAGFGLDGGEGFSFTRNYPEIRYKDGSLDLSQPKYWLPDKLPA